MNYLSTAQETLLLEAESIKHLSHQLDDSFNSCIDCLLQSKGRIVVTGIGKSANIATKIVATFNSTGSPSIFMHAADAVHGDLGIVQQDDIVICLSNSGNTPEIKMLVRFLKKLNNKIIALTGNLDSFLAENADFVISSHVQKEACPNNLAPTCSTTAQLAIGDAVAVCLLTAKKFNQEDFAKYHPGGNLGKKLFLTVGDLIKGSEVPSVSLKSDIKEVIIEISSKRLGAAAVLNNGQLMGVVTDGDIRRMLEQNEQINGLTAEDIMSQNPKSVNSEMLAIDALTILKQNNISQIVVIDKNEYAGIAHFHDFLREGII